MKWKKGQRVQLKEEVVRFPDFFAGKGMKGTVAEVPDADSGCLAGKMDVRIDGAEEWDNQVWWEECEIGDADDDIEIIDDEGPLVLCSECVSVIGGACGGPDCEWRPTEDGEDCGAYYCEGRPIDAK